MAQQGLRGQIPKPRTLFAWFLAGVLTFWILVSFLPDGPGEQTPAADEAPDQDETQEGEAANTTDPEESSR